jgi:hypothetical protein
VWFAVDGTVAGDVAAFQWFGPDGTVYGSGTWSRASSGGQWCYIDTISISGHGAASMPGNWKVVVTWNGLQLFTLPFTIAGQGSYGGQWSGTTSQGLSLTMTVTNNNVTAYSYHVNFPNLGPDCPSSDAVSSGPSTSIPINGNAFSGGSFSGTFQSVTQASGSLSWTDAPGCSASGTLTWTASKQSAP